MSLRPILTNICADINNERRPDLVVEKMPFDGVIRGIRLASDHGPPGSMMVKKVMVNDRELAPAILGGLLEGLPPDLEWGHVAKNDTVRITVESTHSKNMAWDPVQAVLLVEPTSPDQLLTTLSMEPDGDLCATSELVFDRDMFVTRIVVTPELAMFTRVTLHIVGDRDPVIRDANAHAFEGMDPNVGIMHLRAGVRAAIKARWAPRPGLQHPITMVIYGRGVDG